MHSRNRSSVMKMTGAFAANSRMVFTQSSALASFVVSVAPIARERKRVDASMRR
jgi:hypothetical protein